ARYGDLGRRLPVSRDLLLEADVQVVLVRGVGEVAGARDRPRRADLVGADVRVQRGELARGLARDRAGGPDGLPIDRGDVGAAGASGGACVDAGPSGSALLGDAGAASPGSVVSAGGGPAGAGADAGRAVAAPRGGADATAGGGPDPPGADSGGAAAGTPGAAS